MLKNFIFNFIILISVSCFPQQITLSDQAEISVITVDPGNNLYDTFGHSAFRVTDKVQNIDLAYNYGIYDFNTPNFYGKFAQGKLLYYVAAYPFSIFYQNYVEENRGIREQILNLNLPEKQAFFEFLQNNAKPENRSYLYDFFYDNCATKLKDVAQNVLEEKVQFQYGFLYGKNETLRSLIHQYSEKEHPWGTFGIDLALGSVIDKKANAKDYLFLPDNIFNAYAESTLNGQSLVKETKVLFEARTKEIIGPRVLTPTILFSLIALVVLWITYRNYKKQVRSKWLDFFLFLSTGLIGLAVFLLWVATDHTATKNNYNILWAFAPNLLVAFVLLKNEVPEWIKKYVLFLLILLVLTVLLWIAKIQVFAFGIIPILIALGVRYLFLFRRTRI